MSTSSQHVWWITGASSGIGAAVAQHLAKSGHKVAVSARSSEALDAVCANNELLKPFVLDVTDTSAVAQTVSDIEHRLGPIYGAILNAGIYEPMPASDFSHASAARTFDVNVLGMTRALEPLIPLMVGRQSGHIALMSSLAGWRGLPKSAVYGASKAAADLMAQSLRVELASAGIKVQAIFPGFVETPATKVNDFKMPFLQTPEQAAEAIVRGLEKDGFEISFPTAFALIFKVLNRLPDVIALPLIRQLTKGH